MKRGDSFNSDTLLSVDSSTTDECMPDTEMEPECVDEDMEESIQDHSLDPIQEKEEDEDALSPEKKANSFQQNSRVLQYTKSIQKKNHTEMRQKIKSRKSEAVPKLISFWEGSNHDDSIASDDHGDLSKVPELIRFWEGGTTKKKIEENEDVTIIEYDG